MWCCLLNKFLRITSLYKLILILLSGCFAISCKYTEPESCNRYVRKLSQAEIALVPYQVNDTVHYISNDSVSSYYLTCITRKYFEDIAEYYDKYCNNEKEKVHYSGYYYELLSNIPYFNDALAIHLTVSSNIQYLEPINVSEGFFTVYLLNIENTMNRQIFYFYTRKDDSIKIYPTPEAYVFFQCKLDFIDESTINNKIYQNLNILSGDIKYFDSIYYTSSSGIIRMVDTSGNYYNIVQ